MRQIGALRATMALILVCSLLSGIARAQTVVSTYHNDISGTGANTQETILTPSNVNSLQFGKLFTLTLDGIVYAQPLYLGRPDDRRRDPQCRLRRHRARQRLRHRCGLAAPRTSR